MQKLNLNCFVRPSGCLPYELPLSEFIKILEAHEGLFLVDGIVYDSVTPGKDNLYFAYCFNYNLGRAIAENLYIIDKVEHYISSLNYVITAQGKEYTVFLKD